MSARSFGASPPFPAAAATTLADSQLRANLRQATSTIRQKRDRLVAELADFEQLRSAAAAIKDSALSRLDELLAQFEATFSERGGQVHFAPTAAEANDTVARVVERAGSREVVKVKSMTTAEIGLNEALAARGIDAIETDLAELIVQLGGDLPSHIVVPAIHRNRAEVRGIFLEQMGTRGVPAPPGLSDEPADLAGAARSHLRERFLRAEVAISGANFAVAETGSLVVVESEGNGRMCLTLPRVLISVVGIDKLVPEQRDLEVFLQLLARSATGERMSPYTSIFSGPLPGDGPEEVHVVLLDNGRSSALADRTGRQALRCIRCAACLNVCPVYERVGGHAYGSVYPGPIGAVLTPQLAGVATDAVAASLPFASTLCGACYEACPVKIDIPRLLVHLRARSVERREEKGASAEALAMRLAGAVLSSPKRLDAAERLAGWLFSPVKGKIGRLPGPAGLWTASRDAPVPARQSFRAWWRAERGSSAAPAERGSSAAAGPSLPGAPARARRLPRRQAHPGSSPPQTRRGRDSVLGAVRAALSTAPFAAVVVPRGYRGVSPTGAAPPVALFVERVSEYRARAATAGTGEARAAIASALRHWDSRVVMVPVGFPSEWLPEEAGFSFATDGGHLAAAELDRFDAAVSTCTAAIAETGTVILTGGPGQGRRALSLVPDHLVVVARAEQVVAGVPDAVARLGGTPAQTWVSGPSATSDIELNRVEGVHGPRKLDVVVLVDGPNPDGALMGPDPQRDVL
jgi:L-lactate dehydrogenase complex protein LldF